MLVAVGLRGGQTVVCRVQPCLSASAFAFAAGGRRGGRGGATTPTSVSTSSAPITLPASTMNMVSGTATASADAILRALQMVNSLPYEIASTNANLDTGAYALTLPTAAPIVGTYSGSLAVAMSPAPSGAGQYTIAADAGNGAPRPPPPPRTVRFGRRRQPPARLPGVARTGAFASNFARCVEKKVRTLRTFDACVNSRRANSSYAAMSARSATMTKSGPGDTR